MHTTKITVIQHNISYVTTFHRWFAIDYVEYHKKGSPKQQSKNRLDPVKIKAKRQLLAKPRPCPRPPTLRLARGLARKASDGLPNLRLARGLARKASDGLPNLRLARGLARKALDRASIFRLARGPARKASNAVSILRLARDRLGNGPVAFASTDLPDRTSHPINATNHSRDISRTTARHSRAADEMGSRISTIPSGTGQGRGYRPLCSILYPRPTPALHCAT